jgi:transcriptional regulator with XRE-family HTH domain
MKEDDQFAANARIARENARLTQGDLAALIGRFDLPVTRQTITRIERGDRKVTIGEAQAIANALDTPLEEMLEQDFAPMPSLAEALHLIRADDSALNPRELRQKERAADMLASLADD